MGLLLEVHNYLLFNEIQRVIPRRLYKKKKKFIIIILNVSFCPIIAATKLVLGFYSELCAYDSDRLVNPKKTNPTCMLGKGGLELLLFGFGL